MCVYICMTESLFCTPELTQYSKSTIFHLKKNGGSYSIHL